MYITANNDGVKVSAKELSWRLVHDGTKVISLFESPGVTQTKHNLFVAPTKEECEQEISKLSLTPLPEKKERTKS